MTVKKTGELISIDTLSTIKARLEAEKAEIALKIENYLSIVCTKDTIQAKKAARAELNNKFKGYEDQRGRLKKAVSKQYDDFLPLYKENISAPLEYAESILKKEIDDYEDSIKGVKEAELREYFADYLLNYSNIDFLTFERLNLNITKTANTEALKKQCADFVDKVADEIDSIALQPDQAEIMIEYIVSLNASQAMTTVNARHRLIEVQKAQIEAQRAAYKPIPEAIPEPGTISRVEAEPDPLPFNIAWVQYKNDQGEFAGVKYSYLMPENHYDDYFADQIVEVDTKRGNVTARISDIGTLAEVPERVVPFLKYLPDVKPVDDFALEFSPDDFEFPAFEPVPEEPNERADHGKATIRLAITDSSERIDALLAMLNQLQYSYREIKEA